MAQAGYALARRAAARLHARALRPLRPGGERRRRQRLRAVDAPRRRAHARGHRGPRGAAGAPLRGRPPERRADRAAARVVRIRRASAAAGSRGSSSPTASSSTASSSTPTSARGPSSRRPATRPRTSACTSPSTACSSPATTCSAACRCTSTTAGRPTRSASSSARWTASTRSTRGSRSPATAARSPTCARTSRPTARSSPSALERVRRAVAEHGPITAYDIVPLLHGEELSQLTAGWWLPEVLVLPAPSRGDRRGRRGGRRGHRALGARLTRRTPGAPTVWTMTRCAARRECATLIACSHACGPTRATTSWRTSRCSWPSAGRRMPRSSCPPRASARPS